MLVDIFDVVSRRGRASRNVVTPLSHVDTGRCRAMNISGFLMLKHARIRTRTRTHTRRTVDRATHDDRRNRKEKKQGRRGQTRIKRHSQNKFPHTSQSRTNTHIYTYARTHAEIQATHLTQRRCARGGGGQ